MTTPHQPDVSADLKPPMDCKHCNAETAWQSSVQCEHEGSVHACPFRALTAAQAQIARLEAERDAQALQSLSDVSGWMQQCGKAIERLTDMTAERDRALARAASLEKDAERWQTTLSLTPRQIRAVIDRTLAGDGFTTQIDAATSPATQEPPAGAEGVL